MDFPEYNEENNKYDLVLYEPAKHDDVPPDKINHAGGGYGPSTNTVYIHVDNIKKSALSGKNFYDALVYVMIHEAIHAKRTKDK